MTLETTTRPGGHQLESTLEARFDGDGHALLSCAGCGLTMSRTTADAKFWRANPCDGRGAKVVMIGADSAEHYATIDMLPHDWTRVSISENAQPYELFGDRGAGQAAASSAPDTRTAKQVVRKMRERYSGSTRLAIAHLTGRKHGPSEHEVQTALAAAETDAEREAVEQLAALWS